MFAGSLTLMSSPARSALASQAPNAPNAPTKPAKRKPGFNRGGGSSTPMRDESPERPPSFGSAPISPLSGSYLDELQEAYDNFKPPASAPASPPASPGLSGHGHGLFSDLSPLKVAGMNSPARDPLAGGSNSGERVALLAFHGVFLQCCLRARFAIWVRPSKLPRARPRWMRWTCLGLAALLLQCWTRLRLLR